MLLQNAFRLLGTSASLAAMLFSSASYAEEDGGEVENSSKVIVKENRIARWYLHDVDRILAMSNEEYAEYNDLK